MNEKNKPEQKKPGKAAVRKNIILEKVRVEDYAAEGKSLARVDGKVIFIENTVPGDLVDIRLRKNKKDWAEAVAVKFHSYSPGRVDPFCSHFGVCGGCQWQMLPYERQLFYKQRQVEEILKRIGKIDLPLLLPIIGATETIFYRNKIEYTFGNKKFLLQEELNDPAITGKQDVAGFHAKGFFDKVVDIETCYLQAEPTNAIRHAVKEFAIHRGWTFYDARNHEGFLRNMQVRLCTTGELMVNIIVGEKDEQKIKLLMDHIAEKFTTAARPGVPGITTLLYTVNLKWNDSLQDLEPVIYSGKGYVTEKLSPTKDPDGYIFKIGPRSFFQTNTKQAEQLYRVTQAFAELTGKEIVYDLYCGTGSIGIFLSKKAKKIIGIELIAAAIEDAKENAGLNKLQHASFFTGDVIDICNDEFIATNGKPDVIITDPPRAGMHEKLLRKILEMEARVVVYVSCNPATQARDLNVLGEKYEVTRIQPVDMFPHTHHIENVVQLKMKNR